MGRAPCCDKANVKKGPWSPEEDNKMKSYIAKNGPIGNWITFPSKAGLKRCGKSCRLRWMNYLRPDIVHGNFSKEEDAMIYHLYSKFGSRWSLIAHRLKGRTDNDVKNRWNTRLKKRLFESSRFERTCPNFKVEDPSPVVQQQQQMLPSVEQFQSSQGLIDQKLNQSYMNYEFSPSFTGMGSGVSSENICLEYDNGCPTPNSVYLDDLHRNVQIDSDSMFWPLSAYPTCSSLPSSWEPEESVLVQHGVNVGEDTGASSGSSLIELENFLEEIAQQQPTERILEKLFMELNYAPFPTPLFGIGLDDSTRRSQFYKNDQAY